MSDIADSIRKIVKADRDYGSSLSQAAAPARIPAKRSAAPIAGGTGIASPLTEQSRTTTTYEVEVPPGATSLTIEEAETITFTDANGNELVMNLAVQNPTEGA